MTDGAIALHESLAMMTYVLERYGEVCSPPLLSFALYVGGMRVCPKMRTPQDRFCADFMLHPSPAPQKGLHHLPNEAHCT